MSLPTTARPMSVRQRPALAPADRAGSNWLSDAYAQNELVLASLRLATEFLTPGGPSHAPVRA